MLKKKSNKIQILVIISLFFLIQSSLLLVANYNFFLGSGENTLQHEAQPIFQIKRSSYNNVVPFIIDDNGGGDYTWVQLEGNFSWCTGNGTINNPYIINRIAINGMNSSSCIEIKFSLTSYFVIKNSLFYNSSDNNQDAGIEFFSVRYGLLENNTCINNNAHGFYGWGCDNTTFFQNNFSYNALNGIYLFSGSDDNQISENKVSFNQNYGIYFHSSNLNTINDNQIEYNDNVGIRLLFAENTTITSNIIYENDEEGIMNYQGSHYTTICGNNVSDNMGDGVYLFLSNNLDVSNNSINHNNNGIWSAQIENMTIMNNTITDNSGSGFLGTTSMKNCDIIGNNFSSNYDNGIIMYIGEDCEIRDNYIFKNGDFTSDHGIELWNFENGEISNNHILESFGYGLNIKTGSQNIIKENQISKNNGYGLYIEYGSQNLFNGNNITENQNHGMFIYGNIVTDISANNSIDGNRIYKNNGYGIYLVNIQFLPSDSNISDNTITKNSGGAIYIERSTGNIIEGNTMTSNANYGMRLYSVERCVIEDNIFENHSSTAFFLQNGTENSINYNIITNSSFGMSIYTDSHDNEIYQNDLLKNTFAMLVRNNADNNTFSGNTIQDSSTYGIKVDDNDMDCDGNLFYNNWFINNSVHASEETGTNFWNNSLIGNYWDNYTGVDDSPEDGIGDTPHNLIGGIDYLPIWDDDNPVIFINLPGNNSRQPNQAPYFNVIGEDLNFDSIWYTLDNGITNITISTNGSIDQSYWSSIWNVLNDGEYIEFTFFANDTFGNIGNNKTLLVKDDFPEVNLISPLNGTQVQRKSLDFIFEVFDFSRDDMWYTIDGNDTKYFFSTNGSIESTAFFGVWDSKLDGELITLEFFANDTHGQVSSDSITLIKKIPPTPPSSGIPGYNLIFILTAIVATVSIIYNISTKKRKF